MWISPDTVYDEAEIDEIFWYIKIKHGKRRENIKIVLVISLNPRQILGFRVTRGEVAGPAQEIVNTLPPFLMYKTDGAYSGLDYPVDNIANSKDKSDTHNIESVNADLRQHIPGLHRSSRCFYRSIESLVAALFVFSRAYNRFGAAKKAFRENPENIAQGKVYVIHQGADAGKKQHKFKEVPFSIYDFFKYG